jgi:hypothetical protein
VAPFLSSEWISALTGALEAAAVPAHDPFSPFALRHVVSGVPDAIDGDDRYGNDHDGCYGVVVSDDGLRVVRTGAPAPGDLVFRTDYGTAIALNRGELSAQEALESGRLEVRGRLDRVSGARKLLVALEDAAQELRATTTYDPTP